MRGFTFDLLLAVKANVEKRCEKEGWVSTKDNETLLTPDKVTLYDLNKYSIKPYTKDSKSSLLKPYHPLPVLNLQGFSSAILGAKNIITP